MRFVHIADLHLGKVIHQQNLLDIQKDLLDQIINYMNDQNIGVLIMAGDIYDRSIPSNEAISVLNDFLNKIIFTYHKKVLIISGNHDSSERLNFASSLLASQGLHIVSFLKEKMEPVIIDNVNFYLLPFFKPSYIKYLYNDSSINTYNQAMKVYLEHQNIDYTKTNVLVTHQFVAGNNEVVRSESEVILSVGGSEIIDVDLFTNFDYVALGHLHASQQIKKETIRYSGSLMKYSFDEVNQVKGIVDVVIEDKKVDYQIVPLKPLKDLKKYRGLFEEFLDENKIDVKDDFIALELEDKMIVPNAVDHLKIIYPNLLQLTYPNLMLINQDTTTKANVGFENLDMLDLYTEFYEKIKGEDLSEESKNIVKEIIEEDDNYAS